MLPSKEIKKSLQIAVEMKDVNQFFMFKWDGHDLVLQSPKDAKINIAVTDSPMLRDSPTNLKSKIPNRSKSFKSAAANSKATVLKAKSNLKHSAVASARNLNKSKKTKKMSRGRREMLALQCVRNLYNQKKEKSMDENAMKDIKLLFVDHKGMNENAMADIRLMPMIAQYDRFEKHSVKNEEWQYQSLRSRASKADKRSKNRLSNKVPVYGVFDVIYDQNESFLEFIRFAFSPLIESDQFIPELIHLFSVKTFVDDDTLSCIDNLFNGKLNRINYVEKTSTPKAHKTNIDHTCDTVERRSELQSNVKLPVLPQKSQLQSRVQVPHRSKNDIKSFSKVFQQRS
eukprot:NODE_588_length_6359_cov_0.522843.p3 type:complete len:342 gc:universal NODE_588_length_6359_cov_0.522843:3210-2185(-)